MIVTLGRQCGCAGDEVGKKLSELLGIPFYTKPELIALAKEKKIYEKYPMYFGEQPVNAMISSVADDFCPKNQYDTPKRALSAMFGGQSFIMPTGMIRMLSGCFCAEIRSSGRIISRESIRSRSERL